MHKYNIGFAIGKTSGVHSSALHLGNCENVEKALKSSEGRLYQSKGVTNIKITLNISCTKYQLTLFPEEELESRGGESKKSFSPLILMFRISGTT